MATEPITDLLPSWVLPGIAWAETRSVQARDGSWIYNDRRRGKAGEIGIGQVTRSAFDVVTALLNGKRQFRDLEDPEVGMAFTAAYLVYLRGHCRSWNEAVRAYNAGLTGMRHGGGKDYLERVKAAGGMQ